MSKAALAFLLLFLSCRLCASVRTDTLSLYYRTSATPLTALMKADIDRYFAKKTAKDSLIIQIAGYASTTGHPKENLTLSQGRAESARAYIASKMIKGTILSSKGYGEITMPIVYPSKMDDSLCQRTDIYISYFTPDPAAKVEPPKNVSSLSKATFKAGEIIAIPNLYFQPSRHTIKGNSLQVVQELVSILETHATMRIELRGHVCCIHDSGPDAIDGYDDDTQDYDLSIQRAKAVYDFLIVHGISADRLEYHGFGGKYRLNPDITEDQHQQNRRVEIKVLGE